MPIPHRAVSGVVRDPELSDTSSVMRNHSDDRNCGPLSIVVIKKNEFSKFDEVLVYWSESTAASYLSEPREHGGDSNLVVQYSTCWSRTSAEKRELGFPRHVRAICQLPRKISLIINSARGTLFSLHIKEAAGFGERPEGVYFCAGRCNQIIACIQVPDQNGGLSPVLMLRGLYHRLQVTHPRHRAKVVVRKRWWC